LGLARLDIDTEEGGPHEKSIIPESLRHPRNTVSSLLAASPEVNAQIRLNALATAFFEPLQELRGEKRYFVSNKQFSSLDCLILGYFSLMLVPELPQPWLANTMRKKFPGLSNWTEALIASVFGPETTLEDAFSAKLGDSVEDVRQKRMRNRGILPWKTPDNGGVISVSGTFLASVADSIPVVGQLRRNTRMRQHGGKTPEEEQSRSWQTITSVGGLIASIGLMIGYAFHAGFISLPLAEEKREEIAGLDAFGEAGAALGLYAEQIQTPVWHEPLQDDIRKGGVPVAEVDVEVELR
jgi:sorting and assembly machinery component 37